MNKFIFFSLLFLSFLGCKKSSNDSINSNTETVELLPEQFEKFYYQFHSDSAFQIQHIIFPLEGKAKLSIGTQDTTFTTYMAAEDWKINKLFDANNPQFKRQFFKINDNLIIEKISGAEGLFYLERRFANLGDEWNLIYYSEIK
ncbi:MAG: hypothetical protein R2771_14770 [Saprospiraceae bacterium]